MREIRSAVEDGAGDIIIGHGSGSFAHIPAQKYKINDGLSYKFSRKGASITDDAAHELNGIVVNAGIEEGLNLLPFSPHSFAISKNGIITNGYVESIKAALKLGFIPITYGDVMLDTGRGVSIASTEEVFRFLSSKLKPNRIIVATDVLGVFQENPKLKKNAKLIRKIDRRNIDTVLEFTRGSDKIDVTGGMRTKVEKIYEMVKASNATGIIASAKLSGNIRKMLIGKVPDKSTLILD